MGLLSSKKLIWINLYGFGQLNILYSKEIGRNINFDEPNCPLFCLN
jgi:hypothetical protein